MPSVQRVADSAKIAVMMANDTATAIHEWVQRLGNDFGVAEFVIPDDAQLAY